MNTKLEIYNMALVLAGEEPIVSTTQADTRQTALDAFWLNTIKEVLRSHDWNCARNRVKIAADASTPEFEFAYKYKLPADCVAVRRINQDLSVIYRVEGRYILTDEDSCELEYTKIIDNPAEFDALLTEAIYTKLAVMIIKKITGENETTTINLLKIYQNVIAEARLADFREGYPGNIEADNIVNFRR